MFDNYFTYEPNEKNTFVYHDENELLGLYPETFLASSIDYVLDPYVNLDNKLVWHDSPVGMFYMGVGVVTLGAITLLLTKLQK